MNTKNQKIKIPQPKVKVGDRVWARNYRSQKGLWEQGVVRGATFSIDVRNVGSWSYGVLFDRRSKVTQKYGYTVGDNPLWTSVRNDTIKLIK